MTREDSAAPVVVLGIPDDTELLAAVGVLTIRHSHLDRILKLVIKTLMNISVREAVDANARLGSRELRKRIIVFAKQKLGEGESLLKLQALLERAQRASNKRNDLIHSIWAQDSVGNSIIVSDDHSLRSIPTVQELKDLSAEILGIIRELNEARYAGGFLYEALDNEKK